MEVKVKDKNGDYKTYDELVAQGEMYRFKARAECFPDVLEAFQLLHKYGINTCRVTIRSFDLWDAIFDFYTSHPLERVQTIINYGNDLHRIVQTIKPYNQYTGEIDNSFFEPKQKESP